MPFRAIRTAIGVLECAGADGSEIIVTGDEDLLELDSFRGIEIVKVADYLVRFSR